jgi:hypothetical protein
MDKFEITYANGKKDWFEADCLADFFESPEDWGRERDCLKSIISVVKISE